MPTGLPRPHTREHCTIVTCLCTYRNCKTRRGMSNRRGASGSTLRRPVVAMGAVNDRLTNTGETRAEQLLPRFSWCCTLCMLISSRSLRGVWISKLLHQKPPPVDSNVFNRCRTPLGRSAAKQSLAINVEPSHANCPLKYLLLSNHRRGCCCEDSYGRG